MNEVIFLQFTPRHSLLFLFSGGNVVLGTNQVTNQTLFLGNLDFPSFTFFVNLLFFLNSDFLLKSSFSLQTYFVMPKCLIGDVIFLTCPIYEPLLVLCATFQQFIMSVQFVASRREILHLWSMYLWLVHSAIFFFFKKKKKKFGTYIILQDFYHGLLLLQDEFPECDSISDISSDIDGNVTHISHEDLDNDSSCFFH